MVNYVLDGVVKEAKVKGVVGGGGLAILLALLNIVLEIEVD